MEREAKGLTGRDCGAFVEPARASRDAFAEAAELKRKARQIDVTIHAFGILLCLPHILEDGEKIEYVSLGAGNTGRQFALETNLRIAEFKFIGWRGGAEAVRQDATFKDFYLMAAHSTSKRKCLYLLGTQEALRFFQGGRALTSVLSRYQRIQQIFFERFGQQFRTVGEYYAAHSGQVAIEDVSPWVPELGAE